MIASGYRGRLAPSPTGKVHFGTARTALVAFLAARAAGGELLLRIEDIDTPRVVPGAALQIERDLAWLGIRWDEGPIYQSQRSELYERALSQLHERGLLFECSCTRREVAEASSAPHGELGPRYPGTCRDGPSRPERARSLRFRMAAPGEEFVDGIHGNIPSSEPDDFIVRRSDGLFAYQLAVVVDDLASGVTEVVRGDDLLPSTPRQLALYRALGAVPPRFAHVPLVLGPDGARLSKRHGSIAIADEREAGRPPELVVGALAASLGLCPPGARRRPDDLVESFALARLPRTPWSMTTLPS